MHDLEPLTVRVADARRVLAAADATVTAAKEASERALRNAHVAEKELHEALEENIAEYHSNAR